MKRSKVLFALLALGCCLAGAQTSLPALAIGPEDLVLEARDDGGYDLYVRAKPGLGSVLLTESTKDPAMKADNFAYRAAEYNEVNGPELRLLNGKPLPPANKLYSLISSTPRPHPVLGRAFHILIPPVLVYGYPWSRSGTVAVGQGTYLNIRAFAKAYADYSGAFRDNPYSLSISTKPVPPPSPPAAPPEPSPPPPQVEAPPPPPDDRTSSKLGSLIVPKPGQSLDLVVCLDTTDSMVPYVDDLRKNLGPILRAKVSGFSRFRLGIVFFKDYWPEDYITQKYPFTSDIEAIIASLKGAKIYGGGDIPEAEVEALYSAATDFDWTADQRQIILVTDAPPHPDPKGKLSFADLVREAKGRSIELDAIIEPQKLPDTGSKARSLDSPTAPWMANLAKRLGGLGKEAKLHWAVDSRVSGLVAADLGVLSPRGTPSLEPAPAFLAQALDGARSGGADYLVLVSTLEWGAFRETTSRLVDTRTGKDVAKDVLWTALSGDAETAFVNGRRIR